VVVLVCGAGRFRPAPALGCVAPASRFDGWHAGARRRVLALPAATRGVRPGRRLAQNRANRASSNFP